jgi:hypothetical protein
MQNLDKLMALAKALPADKVDAGVALVTRMGEVIEGFGDKPIEWRPETAKLVQGTSDRSKLPKGATIGSIVLGEEVVAQPYPVIAIRLGTTRQYWDPNPENAKTLCSSPDGTVGYNYGECRSCPYSKFDEVNNKSQCNKTLSVLCISTDLTKVFTVNFSKTNYMSGMDWQSLMKKAGVAPYKRIYALSAKTSTKSKNVELLSAEPLTGQKVEGPMLDFIEELFRISGEDRKQMLVKFYEYADAKKKNQGIALAAPDDVVLIGSDVIDEVKSSSAEPVEVAAVDGKAPRKDKFKF